MKVSKPTYGAVSAKFWSTETDTAFFNSVLLNRNNTKGESLCYQT